MTNPQARILLLDDDKEVTDALAWLLDSVKISSAAFHNADEFILAVQQADGPICAVVDLRMPEVSGLEVQHRLLTMGVNIPLVFLSAHGDVPAAVNAIRHGALDFLQKPFNAQEFLDVANRLLREAHQRFELKHQQVQLKQLLSRLSSRETDVLGFLLKGYTSKETARLLEVSSKTIDVHRANILRKMQLKTVPELMRKLYDKM